MHERSKTHETHSRLPDWFAESFFGQIVYKAGKSKTAWYPEEDDSWIVPEKYYKSKGQEVDVVKNYLEKQKKQQERSKERQDHLEKEDNEAQAKSEKQNNNDASVNAVRSSGDSQDTAVGTGTPPRTDSNEPGSKGSKEKNGKKGDDGPKSDEQREKEKNHHPSVVVAQWNRIRERNEGRPEEEIAEDDHTHPSITLAEKDDNIVTWYGPTDPANPQNWSVVKKCWVTFLLCLLTFSIYIGSAIYSPGYESLIMEFPGTNMTIATLGLTLFVIGYGTGPLFLAPLSEIPAIGRTPPYVITLALFVILQPITATVQNIPGLLVLRFLAGFIGSPVLATGGASLGDMFSPKTRPYAIGIWGLAAVQGPVLGPLLGGFAIQAKNWRWAFWILLWLDGFCLFMLIFFFPETSSATILLKRAKRLRKRTGNENLKSEGEIQSSQMTGKDIAMMTLVLPIWMSISEPICFFLNLYIGLVYAILYVWIESFQLVFVQIYGFNLGENGLAYMGLLVGGVITYIGFCIYNWKTQIPEIRGTDNRLPPERRLPVAMFGSIWLPICLFSFGATSMPSIHWIVPIICSSFFSVGTFLLFQSVLNYLQDAYPDKAASVLAGNDFFRSMMGACFPLFSIQMFERLGFHVFWGSVLLGCLSLLFVPIPFVLYRYGRAIRMRSKYARHDI